MQQEYIIVYLCLLFISIYSIESTTTAPVPSWPGDPAVCTISPTPTPAPSTAQPLPPILPFSSQAEFGIETIRTHYELTTIVSHELILSHYVYDYDNNRLTAIDNRNGTYDSRFYDYSQLRESIYLFNGESCHAREIPQNDPTSEIFGFIF